MTKQDGTKTPLTKTTLTAAALAAAVLSGASAEAAPRRNRVLIVKSSHRAKLLGATVEHRNEQLQVRLRKKVAFGIAVTRATGEVRRGHATLRFRSRKWTRHELVTTTDGAPTYITLPGPFGPSTIERPNPTAVKTAYNSALKPFVYRDTLTRVPRKRTTWFLFRQPHRAAYAVHTGAVFANRRAGTAGQQPGRFTVRLGARGFRVAGKRRLVELPVGATLLDGLKAGAYVQACATGLTRMERYLSAGEFRGEYVGTRAGEALPEATAFSVALSTFLYQRHLVQLVPASMRPSLERLLDVHMAQLAVSTNPAVRAAPALTARQRALGNRSAANVLSLLNDLVDAGADRGLDGLYPERYQGTSRELIETLQSMLRRHGTGCHWDTLVWWYGSGSDRDRAAVIGMNGLDRRAPIKGLGEVAPLPVAPRPASPRPRVIPGKAPSRFLSR